LAQANKKGTTSAARRRKPRRRGGCWTVLFLALVLLLAAGGAAAWGWWTLTTPFQGYAGAEKLVTVEPGMGASQILSRLAHEGVLRDARLARLYLVVVLGDPPMQAGEYRFSGPLDTPRVLTKLVRGEVVAHSLTLVEGLTTDEVVEQLVKAHLGRAETFLSLVRSPELVSDLDPEAPDLEGYLFPETYSFRHGLSEREVVATLVRMFRDRFERSVRPALLAKPGRTLRQVLTLASIVEKEAKAESERPLIAAVYQNRLDRHIGLAADPTVIFALKRLGRWDGNLHRVDLHLDSPYNTYRYAGLPPGPICSPGLASLRAAADPAPVPYLYFVSRNDGTHVFAQTLEEHNRNVEQWQKKYWRDRWAEERRQKAAGQPPAGSQKRR